MRDQRCGAAVIPSCKAQSGTTTRQPLPHERDEVDNARIAQAASMCSAACKMEYHQH